MSTSIWRVPRNRRGPSICALSSAASEATSYRCERWDNRSRRSTTSRRPLAQPRPSAAPQNRTRRPVANSIFRHAVPAKSRQHPPRHEFPQHFDSCTAVAPPPPRGLWAASAHPADPKNEGLFAVDGRKKLAAAPPALRGGRAPSLTSLVDNCLLYTSDAADE